MLNSYIFLKVVENENENENNQTNSLLLKLLELNVETISVVVGKADRDWIQLGSLFPEGLFIQANLNNMQEILSVVYDLFMIGTIDPRQSVYPHVYFIPVRPCTFYYARIQQMIGVMEEEEEEADFVHKMLNSPYTSFRKGY